MLEFSRVAPSFRKTLYSRAFVGHVHGRIVTCSPALVVFCRWEICGAVEEDVLHLLSGSMRDTWSFRSTVRDPGTQPTSCSQRLSLQVRV